MTRQVLPVHTGVTGVTVFAWVKRFNTKTGLQCLYLA
jgi:hypothetical protein